MYQLGLSNEIIVDSFAGGGGASTGIEQALGHPVHIAVNHDAEAVALHAANHPYTKHFCQDVRELKPVEVVDGRKVGLLWASPDCKHFSKAKGGKPVSKKIRGLAWVVVKWAAHVRPRVITLENVEEFVTWGPLRKGKPCQKRKGKTFNEFVGQLRALGYKVEWKELRACDFGAPTIRKRFFLIARCDGRPIVWPKPSHGKPGSGLLPYRTAAEIIDWSIPCPSIFERKRPLAENTLRRIARGIQKYVIDNPQPFIVKVNHSGGEQFRGQQADEPLQTITAKHGYAVVSPMIEVHHGQSTCTSVEMPLGVVMTKEKHALVSAVIAGVGGRQGQSPERPVDRPMQTVTAKAESVVACATMVQVGYGEKEGQSPRAIDIEKPLGTVVAGGGKHAAVTAFMTKFRGQSPGTSLDEPLHTVTAGGDPDQKHAGGNGHAMGVASVWIAKHYTDVTGQPTDSPLGTVTTIDHHAVVAASIMKMRGENIGHAADEPLHTITGGGTHFAEVRAFLIKYFGTEQDPRLEEPLHTVTTKDRFGLVTIRGEDYRIVDIGMRMLTPRELYRAQGFPETYIIDRGPDGAKLTKEAQVRMCGNSVCPPLARAIVAANMEVSSVFKREAA